MKAENLIHIRLGADEAIRSKKDILSTEIGLIKIAQHVSAYKKLRSRELEVKVELDKKMTEFKNTIRQIKGYLPKIKVPKILEDKEEKMDKIEKELKEETKEENHKKETIKKKKEKRKKEKEEKTKKEPADNLESELEEIQRRLKELG